MPSLINPELKKIAQQAKRRHFRLCRKCGKKFRSRDKCPRCNSREYREVHQDAKPIRKGR